MSGEKKDLRGGSDSGSKAYLQTCGSNTCGQVINYTLIRRDDLISPIKERQRYDSWVLNCAFFYAELNKPSQPELNFYPRKYFNYSFSRHVLHFKPSVELKQKYGLKRTN